MNTLTSSTPALPTESAAPASHRPDPHRPASYPPLRSFVKRAGRISDAQRQAYEELGPVWTLPYQSTPPDWEAVFQRTGPCILEIGFGMGTATAQIASAQPGTNFLGVEVHVPGVGALLKQIDEQGLRNIRIIEHDAVEVVQSMFGEASLDGIHIFFPDPWHKARHHKRRLIQPAFVQLLATRLKLGGYIHCATDWEHYAQQMLEVLCAEPLLRNTAAPCELDMPHAEKPNLATQCVPRPAWRPVTKFEKRGLLRGHGIWDFVFQRHHPASS